MSAAAKKPYRVAMIAKVKIGQKELGWADDVYRAVLHGRYGKDSASKLTDNELVDFLEHMKACGFTPKKKSKRPGRRMAESKLARKIRALWLSLHHLAEVDDPSEKALLKFAQRVTKSDTPDRAGVQALQWLTDQQAYQVIEALKAWGGRAGVTWEHAYGERACVIDAQWRKLKGAGLASKKLGAFQSELIQIAGQPGLFALSDEQKDAVIQAFGQRLREAKHVKEG